MKSRIVIVSFEIETAESIRDLRDGTNVTLRGEKLLGVERPKVNVVRATKGKAKR